ncbi:hypothetical protein ACRRTK_022956 [Alexandromys fortis]
MAPKCVRLLLLLSFVTGPEVMSAVWRPSCPAGWFYYSSHCYGYFRKMGSWSQAEKQSWQWIDGSLDQYIPWNYRTKSEARHCAALNPKDSFLSWNKNGCSERQHFLCKYRP